VHEQISELEKRESRLKEVFKTQVSNFREACYCLFGYRVDMASQVCSLSISGNLHIMSRQADSNVIRQFHIAELEPNSSHGVLQATPAGGAKGPPPTTFVLKPQHADEPSAQLLFKMEPDGGMVLLPNAYVTKHLSREVETFITR